MMSMIIQPVESDIDFKTVFGFTTEIVQTSLNLTTTGDLWSIAFNFCVHSDIWDSDFLHWIRNLYVFKDYAQP